VRRRSRPKLAQHFLLSGRYPRRIVESLRLPPDELVVEIGPGRGALTELLAERAGRVVAIELDPALARALKEKHAAQPKIEILHADILATDIDRICRDHAADRCTVFGSLPYYITSPIIHHLLGFAGRLRAMALVVQREVAARLTARPGSKAYSYLTVLVRLHALTRIALAIPPGAFSPAPRVHSALVDFQMTTGLPDEIAGRRADFLEFVKRCFLHKRKNLVNNLAPHLGREKVIRELANLNLPTAIRAEGLELKDFAALFGRLEGKVTRLPQPLRRTRGSC
jgi:16S rRNA (adenine1518-N6/adenine1519-N6)-dimethyltransferase